MNYLLICDNHDACTKVMQPQACAVHYIYIGTSSQVSCVGLSYVYYPHAGGSALGRVHQGALEVLCHRTVVKAVRLRYLIFEGLQSLQIGMMRISNEKEAQKWLSELIDPRGQQILSRSP